MQLLVRIVSSYLRNSNVNSCKLKLENEVNKKLNFCHVFTFRSYFHPCPCKHQYDIRGNMRPFASSTHKACKVISKENNVESV